MNEHRDASERLTLNFDEIPLRKYTKVTKAIISTFDLEVAGSRTIGLDEVFQDFKKGNEVVGLEWDPWSGYIVNAKVTSAEPLARDIADFIHARFNP